MNSAPKNLSRADRLLATAQEPNLSSWGWPSFENFGRDARKGPATLQMLLCGLGAALIVAICVAAASE